MEEGETLINSWRTIIKVSAIIVKLIMKAITCKTSIDFNAIPSTIQHLQHLPNAANVSAQESNKKLLREEVNGMHFNAVAYTKSARTWR